MFYGNGHVVPKGELLTRVSHEVNIFFNCQRSNILDDLTEVQNTKYLRLVFMKYNTPLPSSAHVERVFSFASEFF